MELWVRSQDKEHLIKTTDIDLSCEDKSIVLINNYEMAKYKSKERALEIIDEIQNILIIKNSFSLNDEIMTKSLEKNTEEEIREVIKQISVYQMPEE